MRKVVVGLSMSLVMLLLAGAAQAAFWNPVDVVLRDGPSDALLSDGTPVYSGKGDYSRIEDREAPAGQYNIQDIFFFEPKGKRFYSVRSEAVEGGLKLCDEVENRVSFFSRENPDWFTEMSILPLGTTLPADSGFRCRGKGNSIDYYFDFPSSEVDQGNAPECGSITKIGVSSFRFEMPATCQAEVYRFETVKGRTVGGRIEGAKVSLPYQITAELEPQK